MNNINRSPNENIPMEKNKGEDAKKITGRVARDPRMASTRYANRQNVQNLMHGQQIIEMAVTAQQRRDPDLMDISDEESDNGNNASTSNQQPNPPQPRPAQISFTAADTAFGRNILRNSRINNRPRGGRTTFPILDMDEPVFGIFIHALPNSTSSMQRQPFGPAANSSIPPPPPPPLPAELSSSPPEAQNPPPPELPPASIRNSRNSFPGLIPSPTPGQSILSSRTSTDILPSPSNNPQFMSPTEAQSSTNTPLSSTNYFENFLRLQSSTGMESVNHHLENNVFGRLYQDYKKITTNNEDEKNIQANLVKGLKFLIFDRDSLNEALKKRDQENASLKAQIESMANQIQKDEKTKNGLKEMKDAADKKAAAAEKEKGELENEVKKLKGQIVGKDVHATIQKTNLDNLTQKNEKLTSENSRLKKEKEEAQEQHDRQIQDLKKQLQAEKDANSAMQEKLKEAEENKSSLSKELKNSQAKKKEAVNENTKLKSELKELKMEAEKKETQITKLEADQKVLTRSNKEQKEEKDEADKKIKELEEKVKALEKDKEDARAEGKAAGKAEAKAKLQPKLDKYNQRSDALNSLFRNTNIASILSKKRKIRKSPPAAASHTESEAGPSAAKRPRIESNTESSRDRPSSNPPSAARAAPVEVVSDTTRSRTTALSSGNGAASVGTLLSNNGINIVTHQARTIPSPSMPVINPTSINNVPSPTTVPSPMNRPPINSFTAQNQATCSRPTYAFMNQPNQQPQMMNPPNPTTTAYSYQRPSVHIPQQQPISMQNIPSHMPPPFPATPQELQNRATEILQANFRVTVDTAEMVFNNMNPYTQEILRMYTHALVKSGQSNDPNPIIQMIIRSPLFQQQLLQQHHQQFIQQQQIRPTVPQQPQQRVIYDRPQVGHRSYNPGSFTSHHSSRKRTAQAVPNQMNVNQAQHQQPLQTHHQQPPHLQSMQQQPLPPQSLRTAFQPQPPQQRLQPTPPVQSPVVSTHQATPPIPVVSANGPSRLSSNSNVNTTSTPHLTQALNRRSSAASNNDADEAIPNLIQMCRSTRRDINGYVRRRFNVPVSDSAFNLDPRVLDESFRATYRNVTRR